MKVIAVVDADLDTTPLGTASRQAQELHGVPVLRRTLERVCRAKRPDAVVLTCPPDQMQRCQTLAGDLPVTVFGSGDGTPPYRRLIRTARKWALDGWRGGMGGAASLDEYCPFRLLAGPAKKLEAEAVWACSGAAAVVDPAFIDGMIDHFENAARELPCVFAPVVPGLTGAVFETALLEELGAQNIPPGWLLAYKPDAPEMDLAFKECCYPSPQAMRHAAGRLIADTRRATEAVADLLREHPEPDGETAGQWLIDRAATHVSPLPREVEIELTTEDQLPDTPLRPRGQRVPRRGPIDLAAIAKLADELATYDDSLVVLGGFGEPLLHPQFDEVCRLLHEAGIYGLAVRTNGLALDKRMADTLVRNQVDVANVLIDAWTDDLYRSLNPGHKLATVTNAMDRLSDIRTAAKQVHPLLVPQITKSIDNVGELDDFFDGWVRQVGWATIEGFSHYAGQLDDRSVMDMSPPTRKPCRRIRSRCLVLADSRMTVCDQDFKGTTAVGSVLETSLADLWHSPTMQQARQHHNQANYDALPLCSNCCEWHRP